MFSLKLKRSGGVKVTSAVHRILQRGNAARDRRNWSEAAAAFRQALQSAPELAHIWVQLGNMTKEQGLKEEAEAAYLQAVQLRPSDAEPLLQLGHLFNKAGQYEKAGRYYLRTFEADPHLIDAVTALQRMVGQVDGVRRQELIALLRTASRAAPASALRRTGNLAEPGASGLGLDVVFDVSDLVAYFAHNRLPTGIQRVQIELITRVLGDPGSSACCYLEGYHTWTPLSADTFSRVVALSVKSSERQDPEWVGALHGLYLELALAAPVAFPTGAYLVNLGSSWHFPNYFLALRAAKARFGIRYVTFIHDLIPIMAPQHFTKRARRDVVPWANGVFAHADHVLVNSEATRRDVERVGRYLGEPLDPQRIGVIRLDADARQATPAAMPETLPDQALDRWGLGDVPFVLLVSTVESRKGHGTALDAWAELIARHGADRVPKLVCAGKRGWLSDQVYQRLEEDPILAGRVAMLSAVSDPELALLYRTCAFAIYPSLYEGWGLPITEALCYGKPVIASNTSSLPEAGGDFAVYVEPGSAPALAAAVAKMAFDAAGREALAARIAREFRPRSWEAIADQIRSELVRMAAAPGPAAPPAPPLVESGVYYSLARGRALQIRPGAAIGEMLRSGTGWNAPDRFGSRTRPAGGDLAIGLPPRDVALRVGLCLVGAPDGDLDWCVQVTDGATFSGTLDRDGRRWLRFDYPVRPDGGVLSLRVVSTPGDPDARDPEEAGCVGVAGVFVYRTDDSAAGMRLLEAVAFGDLEGEDVTHDATGALPGIS